MIYSKPIYILFLFICSWLKGYGQTDFLRDKLNIYRQLQQQMNWRSSDSLVPEKEVNSALEYLFKNTRFCMSDSSGFHDSLPDFKSLHRRNIHLVDIDLDNDFDLIYDGKSCPGYERGSVVIYEHKQGTYSKLFATGGTITATETGVRTFTFSVLARPCCASVQYTSGIYCYDKYSHRIEELTINQFAACPEQEGLSIPSEMKPQGHWKCNYGTTLHWEASNKLLCIPVPVKHNRIAELPAQITGKVLAYSPKRDWVFVSLEYNYTITPQCFPIKESKKPVLLFGWVLANDITISP